MRICQLLRRNQHLFGIFTAKFVSNSFQLIECHLIDITIFAGNKGFVIEVLSFIITVITGIIATINARISIIILSIVITPLVL